MAIKFKAWDTKTKQMWNWIELLAWKDEDFKLFQLK